MSGEKRIKTQIRAAFAGAVHPGDDNLRNSNEGVEPFKLEEEFRGTQAWEGLDAEFLDNAPDGYASALSFFSHQAFCFFLPAYLIADVDGELMRADPVFHLCHGVDDDSRDQRVNPLRYGDYTWNEYAVERFSGFTPEQAGAIVGYLEHRLDAALTDLERGQIEGALDSYWRKRASR